MTTNPTHPAPEGVRIVELTPDTIEAHLDGIEMWGPRKAGLKELLEDPERNDRFFVAVADLANGEYEVVGNVLYSPDSPRRDDTRAHIKYKTPALSFMFVHDRPGESGFGGRGKHIGQFMLAHTCQVARAEGFDSIYLTVDSRKPAHGFYTSQGFEDWGFGTISQTQIDLDETTGEYPPEPVPTNMSVLGKSLVEGVTFASLLINTGEEGGSASAPPVEG